MYPVNSYGDVLEMLRYKSVNHTPRIEYKCWPGSGTAFYLWRSKFWASERKLYTGNFFFYWIEICSVIERNRAQIKNMIYPIKFNISFRVAAWTRSYPSVSDVALGGRGRIIFVFIRLLFCVSIIAGCCGFVKGYLLSIYPYSSA